MKTIVFVSAWRTMVVLVVGRFVFKPSIAF